MKSLSQAHAGSSLRKEEWRCGRQKGKQQMLPGPDVKIRPKRQLGSKQDIDPECSTGAGEMGNEERARMSEDTEGVT